MRLGTRPRPILQSLAGIALLIFLSGQVACFYHCHFNGTSFGMAEALPPCHATPQSHKSSGGTPESGQTAACLALKSHLITCGSSELIAPPVIVLHELPPWTELATELLASAAIPQVDPLPDRFERLSAPEVYLGPANRSHAPPSIFV